MAMRRVISEFQRKTKGTVLRQVAKPLTANQIKHPKMQTFFDTLSTTMYAKDGAGLAAPQVGQSFRVVAVRKSLLDIKSENPVKALADYYMGLTINFAKGEAEQFRPENAIGDTGKEHMATGEDEEEDALILVNPAVKKVHGTTKELGLEGCLSVPGYEGNVERNTDIEVEYLTRTGDKVERRLTGFGARLFQHERDHLDGILYIDLITDPDRNFWEAAEDSEGSISI